MESTGMKKTDSVSQIVASNDAVKDHKSKAKDATAAPVQVMSSEKTLAGHKAYKILGSRFELPDQYEIIDPVGSGAYGVVVAARDKYEDSENNLIAIKKIEKAFEHKVFAQRTLRELKIMRLLNHENVLSIKNIINPGKLESFTDLYVITELMETDLAQIIKSS